MNLDKLTYAGNLENLKGVEGDEPPRLRAGRYLRPGPGAAACSSSTISIASSTSPPRAMWTAPSANPEIFVETNVLGTVNLLQCAKNAWHKDGQWAPGQEVRAGFHRRGVRQPWAPTATSPRPRPLCPHSPYSSSKASADMFVMAFHDTYGMPVNITRCSRTTTAPTSSPRS